VSRVSVLLCELGDRRRLTAAIDADDENDKGLTAKVEAERLMTGSTSRITSSASAPRTSSGETSWLKRLLRSSSVTSAAIPTPMSLAINSSSSSRSASSSSRRRLKMVLMPSVSRSELRAIPALSRLSQPRRS